MGQALLQSGAALMYYRIWSVSLENGTNFLYYKVGQVVVQSRGGIKKWDKYYKTWRLLLQSKVDITTWGNYYKVEQKNAPFCEMLTIRKMLKIFVIFAELKIYFIHNLKKNQVL